MKGVVIGVGTLARKFFFERRVACRGQSAGARSEGLGLETGEQFFELHRLGVRNYEAARFGFAKFDAVRSAEIADAIQVAEEIQPPRFFRGQRGQDAAPGFHRFLSADRFAIDAGINEFNADGFNIRAKIERFNVEDVHP